MGLPENFDKRLAEAQKWHTTGNNPDDELIETQEETRNCFGTAFFLAGMSPEERSVIVKTDGTIEGGRNIKDLPLLDEPQLGCLVILESLIDGSIEHAGVIIQLDPLIMIDRHNMNGPVREISLNQALVTYPRGPYTVEYRLPTKADAKDPDMGP